jgi:Amiloride-sensitive sodium channel
LENATNCNDCLKTLREIRVPPEEMFVECRFQNQVIDCMDAFRETVIGFGVCHTFNGFKIYRPGTEKSHSLWNNDEGYKQGAPFDTYPHRALGTGRKFGLSVLLRINKNDIDVLCTGPPDFQVSHR